jgi:hypothetical protein
MVTPASVSSVGDTEGETGRYRIKKICPRAERLRGEAKTIGKDEGPHGKFLHPVGRCVVPRGYQRMRLGALRRGLLPTEKTFSSTISQGYALQCFAAKRGQLRLKVLLTGWSLVRIRPGEPN